jgi:predicted TIM-barrel fold metal-dependent hydrolase
VSRSGFFVIDTHHHSGSLEALGLRIWKEDQSPAEQADLEFETRVATLDATGVDQAIILPGHGYLRPEGLADTRRVNDFLAAYRDRLPERFPAAVGVVEPLYGERGLDELRRLKEELGLVGVTFHTRFQGVSTNSPLVIRLVKEMAELGLVPFLHAVAEVADEALWRVQEVARAVPDTTVVVLDAFSSFEQSEQAVRIAVDTPNLVLDTSLSHSLHNVDRLLDAVGHERLVFGTDVYSHAVPHKDNPTLDAVLATGWSDEVKQAVLAGNIRRILGIP